MGTPVLQKLGQKIVIFRGFSSFFRTTGFQLNFLILIEFLNILHWKTAKKNQIGCGLWAKCGPNYVQCCEKSKEIGNIIRFFFIFYLRLPFKARSSGCKITQVEIYCNHN